ncbi:ubiquitin-conjugating enzyme E2 W-like [Myzus persicae]|uniref:ubiquitin-conjugating enzyme E2 W-like n=1 Tax=Myzus persicae TaxID=13164 RepID=UPI000B937678|nr:ubiquitin-conjugating enzyme E2 W-like [Myzus persicae]
MASKPSYKNKIQKELQLFIIDPPPGISVDAAQAVQDPNIWIINMQGVDGTLYEGEQFQLNIKFGSKYPFKPPKVKFVGQNIPVYPFVYDNGHIHLSNLADDWSPVLTIKSVCLSIQSMLSCCKYKKKPGLKEFFRKSCYF